MSSMRRTPTVALVAAMMMAMCVVAVPSPAWATAACGDSSYVNRFDGMWEANPPSSSYAARATIRERNIALCSNAQGATSGAAAWSMLAGRDGAGYAQIGYAELAPGAVTQRFWEYYDGEEQWARQMFANIAAGTSHQYHVIYSFTDGKVRMAFDGVTKATTPFSIEFGEWPTPWEGQWFGETLDRGDDVPGTAAAKAFFRSVGVVTQRDGAYVSARTATSVSHLAVYKFQWTANPTSFDIWTER